MAPTSCAWALTTSIERKASEKWTQAAYIFTLGQRVVRINGVGQSWYAGIKAMDEAKALHER